MTNTNILKLSAGLTLAICGHALAGFANMSGVMVMQTGNAAQAFSLSGNGNMNAGPVGVHSSATNSISGSGNGELNCTRLMTMGGASFGGNFDCNQVPQPMSGYLVDPMRFVTFPTPAANPAAVNVGGSQVALIPAGTHGATTIAGNATLAPGVHIFTAGLSISAGARVSGNGVLIVIHGGAMSMTGQTIVNLSPMVTGDYEGLTIAQPTANASAMTLAGGSNVNIGGTIYAPNAQVNLSGLSDVAATGPLYGDLVVVKRLALSGNGRLRVGMADGSANVDPPDTTGKHD